MKEGHLLKSQLDIICEEAESYFSGVKSKEEVIDNIENRMRLYLSEHSE